MSGIALGVEPAVGQSPAAPDPGLRARFSNSPQMFVEHVPEAPDPALVARFPSMFPDQPKAQAQAPQPAPVDLGRALFPNSPELHAPTPEPTAPAATEPQQPGAVALPEAYADLTPPEGYQLDAAAFAPVAAELGKLGVSREQAEGLLGIHAKMEAQLDASLAAENARWRQEAERVLQPGDRQAIAVAMATAPAEVKQLLGRTGLGNHPALVRWIAALGRRLR